ncbi:hypothetical protein J3R30DRAFT_3669016 [Lentinula aciculospora]|uniref:Six-hairpin glycosidase-like protein n=1 Tax=Lentinula aciculospora TaxID=153920 RepID=A0A9W9DRL4_9AGAR|nr:hypothetical protein J3R30DRAFT_3669016 [Lentinula aciculospora]
MLKTLFLVCLLPPPLLSAALVSPLFTRVPTGSIKPTGWALDQANVQANGLAGHLRDFDSYVNGSIWVEGGSIEYSEMHESAPYWFNGMVALAFQLQNPRLIGQVQTFLEWTLDNQQDDGWLGPELFVANASEPRLVWPRYLLLLGLVQYAEADLTQTQRIVGAMHKFVGAVHDIFANNTQGDPLLGFQYDYQYVRWEEMLYSLQWLYDNHPEGQESQLIETMQLVRNAGFSWKNNWFTADIFPKTAPGLADLNMQTHGVNTGEALKSEALAYRFTSDPSDIASTWERIDLVYTYHGRESGTFAADEHIAGLDPSRGTELCAVVEQIFSLATIYSILGNNSVADRVEKLAYNALPAGIFYDWWSHQYDQQVNQVWAQNMDPFPWVNNGPNSNVFGFEPNYPCCTVNHPAAYPKFWMHSFFTRQNNTSLAHIHLGPSTYGGILAGGNNVTVTVDTLYPFSTTLDYTVSATKPFEFLVRVPGWAQSNLSTISIGGSEPVSLDPDSTNLHAINVSSGVTQLQLFLDAQIQVIPRYNSSVAITRGPLNYALEVTFNKTSASSLRSQQALSDAETLFPNAPASFFTPTDNHTLDNTLLPTSEWRLAIDPSTIKIVDKTDTTTILPQYIWAPDSQPISMTVTACQIEWGLVNGTAAPPPASPNICIGDQFQAKLVPFAAARLRLGEIPVMA